MFFIIGMVIVFASVIFGYVMSHGNLMALWQPYVYIIICDSAFGAFIVATPIHVVTRCFALTPQLIMSIKVDSAIYLDMFGLGYVILNKARREGFMAIE